MSPRPGAQIEEAMGTRPNETGVEPEKEENMHSNLIRVIGYRTSMKSDGLWVQNG